MTDEKTPGQRARGRWAAMQDAHVQAAWEAVAEGAASDERARLRELCPPMTMTAGRDAFLRRDKGIASTEHGAELLAELDETRCALAEAWREVDATRRALAAAHDTTRAVCPHCGDSHICDPSRKGQP